MHENPCVALITPKVVNSDGLVEDSVRNFPSIFTILKKALGLGNGGTIHHQDGFVDLPWVAGMFMLIRRSAFQKLAGFDEKFHLYCEDVDFCARLHKAVIELLWTSKQKLFTTHRETVETASSLCGGTCFVFREVTTYTKNGNSI